MSDNLTNLRTLKTTYPTTRRQAEAISVFTHIESSHNALHEEIMQYFDHLTKENLGSTEKPVPRETWKAQALSNLKNYLTSETW